MSSIKQFNFNLRYCSTLNFILFQYFVYGGYFIVIAMLYTIIGIANIAQRCKRGADFKIWVKNQKGDAESEAAAETTKH